MLKTKISKILEEKITRSQDIKNPKIWYHVRIVRFTQKRNRNEEKERVIMLNREEEEEQL